MLRKLGQTYKNHASRVSRWEPWYVDRSKRKQLVRIVRNIRTVRTIRLFEQVRMLVFRTGHRTVRYVSDPCTSLALSSSALIPIGNSKALFFGLLFLRFFKCCVQDKKKTKWDSDFILAALSSVLLSLVREPKGIKQKNG